LTTSIKTSCGTEILVSSEDLEIISKYNWHINKKGYVRTQAPRINGVQKKIMLHRLIAQAKPQQIVDHINRIRDDNRIANLRDVSQSENLQNRCMLPNNKSGYLGVSWNKNAKKWIAQIRRNNKQTYLGCFDDPKEAHQAYLNAAKKEISC